MNKFVHATVKGLTSTFRIPLIVSGKSLCAPTPSYSTILGFLGCCAGREVSPKELRIGFEYSWGNNSSENFAGVDMETTHRFELKNNKLKPHPKGNSIRYYEFHTFPVLELFLDNLKFLNYLEQPVGIPTLGRSQDLAWIEKVEVVDVCKKESGVVGTTLMPFPQKDTEGNEIGGRILRLPEFFDNTELGMTRIPNSIRLFQTVSSGSLVKNPYLYHINSYKDEDHVIYLHEWATFNG